MKQLRKVGFLGALLLVLMFGTVVTANATTIYPTQSNATSNSFTVTWSPVSGASVYALGYYPADKSTSDMKIVYPTSPSYTFSGLSADTCYKYAVVAYSASGDNLGSSSDYYLYTAPGAVKTFSVVDWSSDGSIGRFKVTNPYPKTMDGIEYVLCKTNGKTVKKGSTSSTPFTISAASNKVYKLKVRGYTSVSGGKKFYGPWTTKTIVPQPKMNALKLSGSNKIKVSWRKVSGATKYIIYGSTKQNSGYKKIATVGKKKSSYVVSKVKGKALKKYKNYYFKVQAVKGKTKSKMTNMKGGYIYTTYTYR